MSKLLKNTTGSEISINDTGISIPASSNYQVVPQDFPLWANSVNVDSFIDSGSIVVNDGLDDLKPDMGKRHIHNESVSRDASYHASAVVQATANSTLTLTVASRLLMIFTGTIAGQIVTLPNATLLDTGFRYEVWNTSNRTVVIKDGSGTTIFNIAAFQKTSATLQVNSTTAGVWLFEANFLGGTGSGNGILNFGYNGTANSGRWYEVISNNPTTPVTGTPFVIAGSKAIRAISVSVNTISTSTVNIIKNGTLLETISLSNAKKNTKVNLNHILTDLDEISVQLGSGTQSRPNVTLWL